MYTHLFRGGQEPAAPEPEAAAAPVAAVEAQEASWEDVAPIDTLGLEVGYRLIPLVDSAADGELVRVVSSVGHLVTHLHATQSIHPRVVAMARGHGHKAIGRVAQAQPRHAPEWGAATEDPDVHFNLWWEDRGVNPNEIMPFFADPASGSAAMAFVVRLEKAHPGDRYGDIQSDVALHEAFFKKAARS